MAMRCRILGPSYPSLVVFEPVPIDIQRGMRTVDLLWRSPIDPEPSGLELIQLAASSVREIERAARDLQDEGVGHSRLAFVQTTNEVTGCSGVIVRRQLADGSLSRPLAELVTPTTAWRRLPVRTTRGRRQPPLGDVCPRLRDSLRNHPVVGRWPFGDGRVGRLH